MSCDYKLKFRILVPVYNVQKYIDQCIASVLEQTYQDFELVLVDDGSPDKCGAICDEYAENDERICVIHQENMGLIAARRIAVKHVLNTDYNDSDYIIFLDSDDYLVPDALQGIYDAIIKTNCDMVIYGMNRVSNGEIIKQFDGETEEIIYDKRQLYKKVLCSAAYNPLCRKAVSIKLLEDTDYSKFYNISSGEDLLQSIPMYQKCKSAYFMNKSLYNYTANPGSITHNVDYSKNKVDFTVRTAVIEFLEAENVFDNYDFAAYRAYCVLLLTDIFIGIVRTTKSFKDAEDAFEYIYSSDYYSRYLCKKQFIRKNVGKKILLYELFFHKKYKLLYNAVRVTDFMKLAKGA